MLEHVETPWRQTGERSSQRLASGEGEVEGLPKRSRARARIASCQLGPRLTATDLHAHPVAASPRPPRSAPLCLCVSAPAFLL
jgi:hypothetical protein